MVRTGDGKKFHRISCGMRSLFDRVLGVCGGLLCVKEISERSSVLSMWDGYEP